MIRLDKLLAHNGYGTRKEVKQMIRSGQVKIDNELIKNDDYRINENEVEIKINDEIIEYRNQIYLMMNKPKGYVCANDDQWHLTVFDLLDNLNTSKLFCVGRLDLDTTGLLIITNDGQLAHNLISPKKQIKKVYEVLITGKLRTDDFKLFENGVIIGDGYKCLPAVLELKEEYSESSLVNVTIQEGKFHQIKMMFKAIGLTVLELKRLKIGNLELDQSLELGEYRFLTDDELKKIS